MSVQAPKIGARTPLLVEPTEPRAMAGMRTKGTEFRRLLCGLRFGITAEPDAAAGFVPVPSKPNAPKVDQQPAAALAMTGGLRR